jgi:hypothetical protein
MKLGTQNFSVSDLHYMANHPNEKANEIGKAAPYHLQYARDGKPNIKPKERKHEETVSD